MELVQEVPGPEARVREELDLEELDRVELVL